MCFLSWLAVDADALDQDSLEARVLVVVLPQPGTARLRPMSLPADDHSPCQAAPLWPPTAAAARRAP